MNKAITDGLQLMPPPFADGLDVWSSGDGTPGSPLLDTDPNAALVPADQDFAGCVEVIKTTSPARVRFTGQTPMFPGCYLRVTARVKAMSGNLPRARISAYAADALGDPVSGMTLVGPETDLLAYGTVYEISAIIGVGKRSGVDMAWNTAVDYAHVGVEFNGSNHMTILVRW